MKKFDLKKFIAENKATFYSSLNEAEGLTPLQDYVYQYEIEISGEDRAQDFLDDIKQLNTPQDVYDYYAYGRELQDYDVDNIFRQVKRKFANLISADDLTPLQRRAYNYTKERFGNEEAKNSLDQIKTLTTGQEFTDWVNQKLKNLGEGKIEEMIDADQSITTEEAFKIAEKFADYLTKFYGIGDQEWTVVRGSVNGPKFDLALDGDRNKGGSYVISTSGNIINVAADNVVHAKYNKTTGTLSSSFSEAKKSKKYYKDAEADDAEHIKALEKDMKDDKKASKKLKEDMSRYFTSPPKTPTTLVDRIIYMYPKMKWLKDELPGWFTFQDVKETLEDAGYGKVYDEFMGGDMGGRMTDLNETNTKMKKSDLKAKIKEMIVAEYEKDVDYTDENPEGEEDFLAEIAAMLDESPMNDPRLKQVIQMLIDMDVDGETMEYILRQVGMDDQMANQLVNYPAEYAASLKEADETEKDTAEVDTTDVAVDDTETVTTSTEVEVDPNVKAVQDALTQAQVAAQKLGDKKLTDQIGNTITFFTREHVVEKPKTAVAEEASTGIKENQSSSPKLLDFVDGDDRKTLSTYKMLGFEVEVDDEVNNVYFAEMDFKGYDWMAVLAVLEDCQREGVKPNMIWNNKNYSFDEAMELADNKAASDVMDDDGVGTKLEAKSMKKSVNESMFPMLKKILK